MTLPFASEEFSPEERELLSRHFTSLDEPVFALVNLPEVVKGALFARYSRTRKSLRRLFLDEFAEQVASAAPEDISDVGVGKAETLYERIFVEYGDDSIAQLGGVHLACEQASQLLCKVLEWGRLAGYLEQSTRYIPYDDKPGGHWRYLLPPEIAGSEIASRASEVLDASFETYSRLLEPMQEFYRDRFPKQVEDTDGVYRSTIRAKACDTLRGLLPAATRSNVGIYASGQSYEQMLIRMRANPLSEVREYSDLMLTELRRVIPAFLTRVDVPDRGVAWTEYLRGTRERVEAISEKYLGGIEPGGRGEVTLTDYEPAGEEKVVAAALYAASELPDDRLLSLAHTMSAAERQTVLEAYVGERGNRGHRPGRAFERTSYRFDVLCDYGAFRDLQRHRLLTLEWQPLSTLHGSVKPAEISDAGFDAEWDEVMQRAETLFVEARDHAVGEAASYVVPMAFRIRFVMQMNAREAMHLIELRSSPQGHPAYRRIAHEMHRLIGEHAGHRAIADAMRYVDYSDVDLERLQAERRTEARRRSVS
ncbi:MAG: FAD-dependent thymidylate synthase [Actinomycetota bacterium]